MKVINMMSKKQFDKYLKYANYWLLSRKKRKLSMDEEDSLYLRLDKAVCDYNEDAEQYDLMTVLCITTAQVIMEIHPQMDTDSKEELRSRVLRKTKKKK